MADPEEGFTPEMVLVTLVPNEPALSRQCPNCRRQFKAKEKVFVSLGEEVMIHATCIVGLALVASLHGFVPATPDGTYEHLRETLLEASARAHGVEAETAQADG